MASMMSFRCSDLRGRAIIYPRARHHRRGELVPHLESDVYVTEDAMARAMPLLRSAAPRAMVVRYVKADEQDIACSPFHRNTYAITFFEWDTGT